MSGGIDSSLVASLLARAIPPRQIHALILPSSSNSPEDAELARIHSETLGISTTLIHIDSILASFRAAADFIESDYALGNLKARIRMALLYAKANSINGIVVGTGNKTEISVGYFTKYGDGGVDILPIGGLYKCEVRELAKYLGVAQRIIDKPPTAGLWGGQTDEDELGISYDELDNILRALPLREPLKGHDDVQVKNVRAYIEQSGHKREAVPICIF